jgi:hypothetical protein
MEKIEIHLGDTREGERGRETMRRNDADSSVSASFSLANPAMIR